MEMANIVNIIGIAFLLYGVWDGFRKGLVKKGTSLVITLVTLFIVYLASPYVETFFKGILPSALSLENLAGTDNEIYRMLVLGGLESQAEEYVRTFAARILSVVVTYVVVRLLLRTLILSLEVVTMVPGLSLLNRLAGAVFGLAQQILTLWIIFLAIAIFSGTSWGAFLFELIRQSPWMSYLFENNLLLLLGILLLLKI